MNYDLLKEIDEYLGENLPSLKGKKFVIYNGDLEIRDKDKNTLYTLNNGSVYLSLLPKPKIYFKGDIVKGKLKKDLDSQELYLYLPDFNPAKILVTGFKFSSNDGMSLSGIITNAIEKSEQEIDRLYFYILNFDDTFGRGIRHENKLYSGRITLNYDIWEIIIDKRPNHKFIYDWLKNTSLYEITHVGVIERTDKQPFKPLDAEFLLNALFWLLSFARGRYIGIDILLGFRDEVCIWESIQDLRVSNWDEGKITWFSKQHPEMLEKIFPLFINKLRDPLWGEHLLMALEWYIDSLEANIMEETFIWVSSALELISWIRFTQEEFIISKDKYDKLYESDKIRLLLHDFGIPIKIPFNISPGYEDGPYLFTEIRNSIVHPVKKEKVNALSFDDRWKAHELGLWYLELTILRLLGYNGYYVNRLKSIDHSLWEGNIEKVPWYKDDEMSNKFYSLNYETQQRERN
ncbi:hypothetical protein CE561_00750 [Thermoanaerobacterium thermosaccharolyticum]|uniref:YopA central domain-containing protein n=1 Tax=Thermoanaerobacterium thermosaccharolyticum TaxID=1517 RepID=A0A231VP73_THETR|nr:hypothetical protein [Thermoanaerobacterium thermosaccharolyticum]OXT09526.1 hypothetical protein CE561_00750 [Thermoanaerobacterium thermosaccharolyticum]